MSSDPMTQEEIAAALGVTRQMVQKIETRALAKFKTRWDLLENDPERFAARFESDGMREYRWRCRRH